MAPTLIDTNALIWYGRRHGQLSQRAAEQMRKPFNFYSHASLWEMAIKSGAGKLELQNPDGARWSAKQFLLQLAADLQMTALPLDFDDLADVEGLPPHNKDPFDRLLVVQARRHGMTVVSADPVFDRYGIKRLW
jgi:PIN domain nuclease of toxin-antitoxin system